MNQINCPFCDRKALEQNLIFETDNFLVFPTKGQITEGYVLIVPKRHEICFGGLTASEIEEFSEVKCRVIRAMGEIYHRLPILFEHGIVGQSVKHAHMHVVPTNVDLLPQIQADFPDYERISSLESLQTIFKKEGPYLYYEDASGNSFLFHIFKKPQYLRLMLAETLGVPERGNWQKMDQALDQKLVLETYEKIKAAL